MLYVDGDWSIEVSPHLVAGLPPSASGIGLDRSRAEVEIAVSEMTREDLYSRHGRLLGFERRCVPLVAWY